MEKISSREYRIAFTGPECSGKTTLSYELANSLGLPYIEEYARNYLSHGNPYHREDLHHIAQEQFRQNHRYSACVCDTDMTVMRIWEQVKYGEISKVISDLSNHDSYDFLFLCQPDIPWEADLLREHPEQRDELFSLYQRDLMQRDIPYVILNGNISERKAMIKRTLTGFINFDI